MDIELLSNMVKELLLDHDSVELPGFGTFVAVRMPASFSDRGYTINPPYRKLNFLPGDHPSDGLLVDLYAESNTIEKSDADSILRKFFLNLKDILAAEKILVFPELGVVKMARNNVCLFVPDADLDISPDFYGLAPLSLKSSVKITNSRPIVLAASGDAPSETKPAEPKPAEPKPAAAEPADEPKSAEPESAAGSPKPQEAKPATLGKQENSSNWWLVPVIILIVVVALLGIFLALAYFAPDLIDKLLYTEEQLQIIHTDLENLL